MIMRLNKKTKIILLGVLPVLLALILLTAVQSTIASKHPWGQAGHRLTSLSPEQVGQVAQDYTQAIGYLHSGESKVLLTRPVTRDDLPKLGLDSINFAGQDPPLMLVILKGDFDTSSIPRMTVPSTPRRVSYIAYVFDLWAGEPALTITSPNGGVLRKALNDPTLPNDGSVQPNTETDNTLVSTPSVKLPYGATAPTVIIPTETK